MRKAQKVSTSKSDIDRHPEVATWLPKPYGTQTGSTYISVGYDIATSGFFVNVTLLSKSVVDIIKVSTANLSYRPRRAIGESYNDRQLLNLIILNR